MCRGPAAGLGTPAHSHIHAPAPPPFPAGIFFFALVLFSAPLTPALAAAGLTPLYAAVLVGAAQNIFSKSSKYSLFDPCKEMAYIPLDDETKVRSVKGVASMARGKGGCLTPARRWPTSPGR